MRRSGAKLGLGLPVRVRRALALVTSFVALLALLGTLLTSPVAEARSGFDSNYGFERTYNAALRLVRIDMGLKITEKDDQTGYFVFDYKSPDSNKPSTGTIEFIRPRETDGPVRVVVQLPQMPRAHEQVLVDSLVRKMRQEYGEPPDRPKKAPPVPEKPPVDAGDTDGDADAETPSAN